MPPRCANATLVRRVSLLWIFVRDNSLPLLAWIFIGLILARPNVTGVPMRAASINRDQGKRFAYAPGEILDGPSHQELSKFHRGPIKHIGSIQKISLNLSDPQHSVFFGRPVRWTNRNINSSRGWSWLNVSEESSHLERSYMIQRNNVGNLYDRRSLIKHIAKLPVGIVAIGVSHECAEPWCDQFSESIDHRGRIENSFGGHGSQYASVIHDRLFSSVLFESTVNGLSSSHEHAVGERNDLASSDFTSANLSSSLALGISNDSNFFPLLAYYDGRSMTHPARHEDQKGNSKQPLYMRIHIAESSMEPSWPDRLNDGSASIAFSLSDRDVDVSFDRKHWFHLLGSFCARHEPPFSSHKIE